MKPLRIGLGVSSTAVRAIGARDGAIIWAIEAPLDVDAPLVDQIRALLSSMPAVAYRWPRPRIVAAVGPSRVQTKRPSGLPPMADVRVASAVIREGMARFFVVNSEPLITSDAMITSSGDVWVAAFDRATVNAIESACRDVGGSLTAVIPVVAVLTYATDANRIFWRDGESCVEVGVEGGRMNAVTRLPCPAPTSAGHEDWAGPEAAVVPGLATLGEDAMRFADAYGAAVSRGVRYALAAPLSSAARVGPVSRRRALIAGGLCAAAFLAAAIAPGIAADRAGRAARQTLGELSVERAELRDAERNLGLVSGALREVAGIEAGRRSPLAFLDQLGSVLPEGSAVVALRLDSATGTVVVLTPRAAPLVNRLDAIGSVVGPEIIGPVTRETVNGRDLERVTVRFSLSPMRAAADRHARAPSRIESGMSVSASSPTTPPSVRHP